MKALRPPLRGGVPPRCPAATPPLPPRHTAADRRARHRRVTQLQHPPSPNRHTAAICPRAHPPRHPLATPRCTKATLPNRTQSGAIVLAIACKRLALIPPQSARLSAGATQPAAAYLRLNRKAHAMRFISPPDALTLTLPIPDALAPFAPIGGFALAVALAAIVASALSR